MGDHPLSVGAQHDVPRAITRFPKGHVKPCPYGTFETSLVVFPVNGCHPYLPPLNRHPRESGDPWHRSNSLDSRFRGNDGLWIWNDELGGQGEQWAITRFR